MARLKGCLGTLLLSISVLLDTVAAAYLINTTVYDTDLGHVTYEPKGNYCTLWETWLWWETCGNWIQPWKSEVYKSQERGSASVHRSLNHRLPSVTINFEGSAIWLYGPPRANLPAIPPDYKICVYESLYMASSRECYRVNVAEAYSVVENYDEPVMIFAKGGLRYQKHQVVVSVGDPANQTRVHLGIQFSHAIYTIERPTPWPVREDHWRFRRVVMHDTHPLLSYTPKPAMSCILWWCSYDDNQSGWTPKTFRAENGTIVSWHQLKSRSEWDRNTWGVETTVTAGSIAVYGIPKAHITKTDILGQICIQIDSGPCRMVDVQHAYLNSEHYHESVLLWRHDSLDPSRKTHVSIRLVEVGGGQTSVFPFKAIHYFEPQQYASPGPPVGRVQNIEVTHDEGALAYKPDRRCVGYGFFGSCNEWLEPWVLRKEGPFGSMVTYRSTISTYRITDDPTVTFRFRGSAVYVYGAPKLFIKVPFASQRVCVDDICHIVDVEQAYLNAPQDMVLQSIGQHTPNIWGFETNNQHDPMNQSNITTSLGLHPEYEPVLIWGITGLDDRVLHTLQMALASLPCEDNAEMSIAKVVYTRVVYRQGERPNTPLPQPDPRYEGPSAPPYARKWLPQDPPSSLPPRPPTPPTSHPLTVPAVIMLGSTVFLVCLISLFVCVASVSREKEPLLPRAPPPQATPGAHSVVSPPPSYTQPPSYSGPPYNVVDDSRTVTSTTSTTLPHYNQALGEGRVRQERTVEYVAEQRAGRNPNGRSEGINNEGPREHVGRGGRRQGRQGRI